MFVSSFHHACTLGRGALTGHPILLLELFTVSKEGPYLNTELLQCRDVDVITELKLLWDPQGETCSAFHDPVSSMPPPKAFWLPLGQRLDPWVPPTPI